MKDSRGSRHLLNEIKPRDMIRFDLNFQRRILFAIIVLLIKSIEMTISSSRCESVDEINAHGSFRHDENEDEGSSDHHEKMTIHFCVGGRKRSKTMNPVVALVGTFDTKGIEYEYLREQIDEIGTCSTLLIDVGLRSDARTFPHPNISSLTILQAAGVNCRTLNDLSMSKAEALNRMSEGLTKTFDELFQSNRLHGLLALGGSCGTAIVSEAIQRSKVLPIGLPKLIVSTLAGSSNAHTAIGLTDVLLMNSVTDIGGGINRINRSILANAAVSVAAMAQRYFSEKKQQENTKADHRPLIAITMFGVTTPCVMEAKKELEQLGYETVLFHATGTGGRTMERLIESGAIDGVLDITTTELADELVGGILSAGPERLEMAARKGIPQVVSLGALDMVNFGPRDSVPSHFENNRLFHEHNAQITLMRTNVDECGQLGELIGRKLNGNQRSEPIELFIPLRGFSALSGK